jgi:hypothetical protein
MRREVSFPFFSFPCPPFPRILPPLPPSWNDPQNFSPNKFLVTGTRLATGTTSDSQCI